MVPNAKTNTTYLHIMEVCGIIHTMQTVTQKIINNGLGDRIIGVSQLSRLIGGSEGRRYGLVNRALKNDELLRLQRGTYILADRFRQHPIHPFALAQALAPGSYISFETALSYHGWIPEKVFTTTSVVPGRKSRKYRNKILGTFTFTPLATEKGYFLELVTRHQFEGQTVLIAAPCRALLDLLCLRKVTWQGIGWISEGLRIDPASLNSISTNDLNTLQHVYKHQRVKSFLSLIEKELFND